MVLTTKSVNCISSVPEALFPEAFFRLVLYAHIEYQNNNVSGKFNKVNFFFKEKWF